MYYCVDYKTNQYQLSQMIVDQINNKNKRTKPSFPHVESLVIYTNAAFGKILTQKRKKRSKNLEPVSNRLSILSNYLKFSTIFPQLKARGL